MLSCSEDKFLYLFDNRDEIQLKTQLLVKKFSFFIPNL